MVGDDDDEDDDDVAVVVVVYMYIPMGNIRSRGIVAIICFHNVKVGTGRWFDSSEDGGGCSDVDGSVKTALSSVVALVLVLVLVDVVVVALAVEVVVLLSVDEIVRCCSSIDVCETVP